MRRFYYSCRRIESGMLKNAIESADYYSDSRRRRHYLMLHYKEGNPDCKAACGASTMDVFHHVGLYWSVLTACKVARGEGC